MIQLFVIIVLVLPILAFIKILSQKLGGGALFITIYTFTWILCAFLYFVGYINSWMTVFITPFISHLCMMLVAKIFGWTAKTIRDEYQ